MEESCVVRRRGNKTDKKKKLYLKGGDDVKYKGKLTWFKLILQGELQRSRLVSPQSCTFTLSTEQFTKSC